MQKQSQDHFEVNRIQIKLIIEQYSQKTRSLNYKYFVKDFNCNCILML